MDPKVLFCYMYVLGKRQPLYSALSAEEVDNFGQINYWIGVELGGRSYNLEVKDMNDFLRKYLTQ